MQIISTLRILALAGLLSLITACGSDDDNGGGTSDIAGIWFGTIEDASSVIHTIKVSVNSDNTISGIYIDVSSTGLTGTITSEPSAIGEKLYSFVLSDSTNGGFYADPSLNYIAYIDSIGSFGVLERGALSLPSYIEADIVGSWSGYSVELDASLNVTTEYTSLATVEPTSLNFNSTDNSGRSPPADSTGSFSGSSSVFDIPYGRYVGTYSNTYVLSGNVSAFLSVDKQFAATRACWGSWPTNCSFSAWTK